MLSWPILHLKFEHPQNNLPTCKLPTKINIGSNIPYKVWKLHSPKK